MPRFAFKQATKDLACSSRYTALRRIAVQVFFTPFTTALPLRFSIRFAQDLRATGTTLALPARASVVVGVARGMTVGVKFLGSVAKQSRFRNEAEIASS